MTKSLKFKNKTIKDWQLIPFVFTLSTPIFIESFSYDGSKLFIAAIFTVILPLVLRRILNISPFGYILLSAPILLLSIIYDLQILEYATYINPSTWYTIFDTHQSEALEFLQTTDLRTRLLVLFQIVIYIYYLFFTLKKRNIQKSKTVYYILWAILLFFIIDFNLKGATELVYPQRAIKSIFAYLDSKRQEAKYHELKRKTKFGAIRKSDFLNDSKETIVIVVGEALRRDHLAYYGYNKPTTPLMDKEDLYIFRDVVSAANQTINSLKRVFTLAEMLDVEDYWKQPSFIKAFKEVGFETYWITTQPVYGKNESEASFIGEETDYFIDHKFGKYDLRLMNSYQNVLKEKKRKKIIFIHILDTHAVYSYRYPEEYNIFAKDKRIDKNKLLINQYDNAVRYNDVLLSKVLNDLKMIEGEKSFIMFSDHGESLFDTPNRAGHGAANPSQSEYNIPLIAWFSKEFKTNHPKSIIQIEENLNKPILSSDMFHAFPALYGIEFDKLIKENCFFNQSYVPKYDRNVVNVNLELLDYSKLLKPNAQSN